jgi:pentatricopeptide repeat protein
MIALNAVSAILINGALPDGGSAFSTETLYTAIVSCLVSAFSYDKVWKVFGLTSSPGGKLATVGIK